MTYFKLPFLAVLGGTVLLTGAAAERATAAAPVQVHSSAGVSRAAHLTNPGRIDRNHMPGWDWWRTYPWSPYNAWRNPYWYPPYNSNYPYPPAQANPGPGYPYPVPYPYAVPVPAYSASYGSTVPDTQPLPAQAQPAQASPIPYPTADMKSPPPNSALIRVRVPDQFTTVRFNGQKAGGVGTTRTYVTPELQNGRGYRYTIAATTTRNGQPQTVARSIDVAVGKVVTVDLQGGL